MSGSTLFANAGYIRVQQDTWSSLTNEINKFVWNPDNGYLQMRYSCHCDVRVQYKDFWVFCKNVTLANSADYDQMLQSVASDQGLHCLFKLEQIKG